MCLVQVGNIFSQQDSNLHTMVHESYREMLSTTPVSEMLTTPHHVRSARPRSARHYHGCVSTMYGYRGSHRVAKVVQYILAT